MQQVRKVNLIICYQTYPFVNVLINCHKAVKRSGGVLDCHFWNYCIKEVFDVLCVIQGNSLGYRHLFYIINLLYLFYIINYPSRGNLNIHKHRSSKFQK